MGPPSLSCCLNRGITHPNYDTSTRSVTLAAGQDLKVEIALDTNMGGMDLIVHPPGITVYIDGKKVGVTQKGETDDLSKVFEIRNLKSGSHTLALANKRAIPSEKRYKFDVKKGRIIRKTVGRFWVKDTYLKLKDGRELVGRIAFKNDDEVHFETKTTSGKITKTYSRSEIEIVRPLKDNE